MAEEDRRRFPKVRPVAVDLFSGAGGMSLGFEQAGFDIVYAVDRDGYNIATHKRNFPYGAAECASVTDLTAERIRRVAHIRGEVDLVFGGPPCQGFSFMGLRDTFDPRNTLVGEFARLIEELHPRAFVMENVPGLLSSSTRPILNSALDRFRRAGYDVVAPLRILNAADFGVPQSRRRLFILGLRRDVVGTLRYPVGTLPGQPERPTVREALDDLPRLEHQDPSERYEAPYTRPRGEYARVSRGLSLDSSDLSRPRRWNRTVCTCVTKVDHTPKTRALYEATPTGTMVPGHKLHRLDPDGISLTLRAGTDSERGSHTAPRPVHYHEPRCITAREAARLHGYPDWFVFYPGKWHAYRQIGNSVCPPVARAVGHQIITTLGIRIGARSPAPLPLPNTFDLPENRPRTSRRIVRAVELPKVVNALFLSRFDPERGEWRGAPTFTERQVAAAFSASGSNMPVRPEMFVEDVTRSRASNLKTILALPLQYGFTIQHGRGRALGEFVPIRA